ncbi:MAG: serine/threonine protein kinase, partial [bacterium]|nr:serine/threonine protein kinase [bacterium]
MDSSESKSASLIGSNISHFRIDSKLGKGGMGEVYRAHDEKLGRQVALKVLPSEFAADEARLSRFEREAKLLASISHPNIATLYGVEEHDGQLCLVMELVEGKDLAEIIAAGPMDLDEALKTGIQIAGALEGAHGQGIIHRDLKPANVRIMADGTAKVLDFGLAKMRSGDGSDTELTQAATVAEDATAEGVVMGTAAYMSPEQARGRPVDRRTDIWAFGCLLFEMLAGKKLFQGETMSDLLVSVLQAEPEWQRLPNGVPVGVRRLLRRCLQRDPQNRLRDAGDAVIELKDAVTGAEEEASTSTVDPATARRLRISAWAGWGIALVALLGILIGIIREETAEVVPLRRIASV